MFVKHPKMWNPYTKTHRGVTYPLLFGSSRSHCVMRNYTFETQKNSFVEHPKMREALARRMPATGANPPKKCEFVFRALTSSLFVAQKRSQPPPTRSTPVPVRDPIGLT